MQQTQYYFNVVDKINPFIFCICRILIKIYTYRQHQFKKKQQFFLLAYAKYRTLDIFFALNKYHAFDLKDQAIIP
jgi:hypothetical protein